MYNKTLEVLSLVYKKTLELNETQPWVQDKAEAHLKKLNSTVEWIHSKLKKQVDRKLNEDVIFYVSSIRCRIMRWCKELRAYEMNIIW